MRNTRLVKELLPIAVLLIFIVVVLVLCAVSAGKKKNQESASAEAAVTEEAVEDAVLEEAAPEEAGEVAAGLFETEGETEKDAEEMAQADSLTEVQETIELEKEVDAEAEQVAQEALDALEAADQQKEKEQAVSAEKEISNSAGTVSTNSTSAVLVKKTNMEMLAEMMDYWSKGNIAAIEDLSGLAHYRAMSAALKGPSYFYYYGERNEEGKPEGKGIAVYGSDQYYYGDWENGMREGEGMWLRMYYEGGFTIPGVNAVLGTLHEDIPWNAVGFSVEPDPVLVSHRYRGFWAQDLPNGEGHEQYIIDIEQAEPDTCYLQNVMGNFKNGLYDGAMYLITISNDGNIKEWNGKATQGVFEDFGTRDGVGRVPVWQDKQDSENHMWIDPLNNIDLGLAEVRAQIKERAEVQNTK